jgi:hypothetical protein
MSPQTLEFVSHLDEWRAAAKRVADAWDVWLASDDAERDWAHEVYLAALDREERAALRLEHDARAMDARSP